MHVKTLECCLSGQKQLAICFEQVGKLWIEQWYFGENPAKKLLASQVSNIDAIWPSSPPWQEVIRETHEGQSVIMAIGRAGQSHWSGSWRRLKTGALDVEHACRVVSAPAALGSTFTFVPDARCKQATNDSLFLELEGCSIQITAGAKTSISDSGKGQIRIQPNVDAGDSSPRTIHWRYSIE